MDTKEIAKLIRKDFKEMKGFKFSVVTERFAGGSSIDVSIMESPSRLIRTMQEIPEHTNTHNYTRDVISQMQLKRYHQLSQYQANDDYDAASWNNGVFLTEDGYNAVKQVTEIVDKYHIDKSDSRIDYFNCNFYFHLNLGKWNKAFCDGE